MSTAPAQHQADRTALAHHVHTEPSEPGHRVGEVGVARGDELLGALLGHDRERDALGLDRRHGRVLDPLERPSMRMNGGEPTLRWTSDASAATA